MTEDEYYFIGGQDCQNGFMPLDNMPDAYYDGYGAAYAEEQMQTKEGQN